MIWSVVHLLHQNPHWCSTVISSMYGLNRESRILDKIWYEVDSSDIPWKLLRSVLSPFLWISTILDSFHRSGNSYLFQIKLMSLWIWDRNVSLPAWISSAKIWSQPDGLYLFNFAIANSTSKELISGTNGSDVCISICLTSLTLCTFNN
jgi:hypothetical protein